MRPVAGAGLGQPCFWGIMRKLIPLFKGMDEQVGL